MQNGPAPEASAPPAAPPTLAEATRVWFKIGCLSFGGAAAQIAMLHKSVVDEKTWVDERRFLEALSYCTLLPGPEAQQLATYLGFILNGVRGGVIAGLLFVLPGAAVMMGLSLLYAYGRQLSLVDGVFLGVKAAVIAIVLEALIKIAKRGLKTRFLLGAALASFVALAFLNVDFPYVIGGAALLGAILAGTRPAWLGAARPAEADGPSAEGQTRAALTAALAWTAIWWAPVALAALTLGAGHLLVEIGLFFSKLAMITFGGAYAVLAYLADAAVNDKGWVTPAEMIDGLGLAETTPGPTILVNQFTAFLAGFRTPAPFGPALGGILAASMAVWVTFAPSFVWIFAGSPFVERFRRNVRIAGALSTITAAVTGVIGSLALTFSVGVLFKSVGKASFGPMVLPSPDWASLDPVVLTLALAAGFMLFRLHRGVIETVLWLAAAGALVSQIGPLLRT